MPSMTSDRRQGLIVIAIAYAVGLAVALALGWVLRTWHPIAVAAAADLAATAVVFAFSAGANNSSIYDPYWSVAPLPLALFWAFAQGSPGLGVRSGLILVLILVWGARLTINQLLRWRGMTDEDFRYVEIRSRTGRWYWPASFVSIHLMPTIWVFLGLLPLYPALARPQNGAGALDLVAAAIAPCAIGIESVADHQLRRFVASRRDPEAVLNTGLWAWSRHPNYFGEVLFWWGLYGFALAASPGWWWTLIGPLSITLLFVLVSVPWMDRRMLARHPTWAAHVRSVSALVPWPRSRG